MSELMPAYDANVDGSLRCPCCCQLRMSLCSVILKCSDIVLHRLGSISPNTGVDTETISLGEEVQLYDSYAI